MPQTVIQPARDEKLRPTQTAVKDLLPEYVSHEQLVAVMARLRELGVNTLMDLNNLYISDECRVNPTGPDAQPYADLALLGIPHDDAVELMLSDGARIKIPQSVKRVFGDNYGEAPEANAAVDPDDNTAQPARESYIAGMLQGMNPANWAIFNR